MSADADVPRSEAPETVARVRAACHDLLDRNHGDQTTVWSGAIGDEAGLSGHLVGQVLRRLADGSVDGEGLAVSRWNYQSGTERVRWEIERVCESGGGEGS